MIRGRRLRRRMKAILVPWRVGPVILTLLFLFAGGVGIALASAEPDQVGLDGSTNFWTFESDQDLDQAGDPAFVDPSESFPVFIRVDVDTDGSPDDQWGSTSYQYTDAGTPIGSPTCIEHANVNADNTGLTLNFTAPAGDGVYGLEIVTFAGDNCTGEDRDISLPSSINVGSENPQADPGCGFSLGLIVDSSGSINDGGDEDAQAVFDAVIDLLTQLQGTGVEASLIDFDTQATIIFQPTIVNAALVANTSANWNYIADGFTNWQDALQTQGNDLNDYASGPAGGPSSVPDFVLFFTDGDPTVRNGATGSVSSSDGLNLTLAVDEANLLKGLGARIIGIGVGGITNNTLSINRLKSTTGPVEADATPNPLTDDIIITDFDSLSLAFQELALSLCGGSLTITKEVPDGQGGWEAAQGWEFTADVSMTTGGANDYEWVLPDPNATPGDPVTGTTNAGGTVSFQWQPDNPPTGASVLIEETIQNGFDMVSVDCQETRLDGNDYDVTVNNLNTIAGTFDIALTNGAIGTCTVRNEPEPEPPVIEVTKTPNPAQVPSGGSVVYTVRVDNDGPGAVNIDSLLDDQFGDITQVQGDVTFTTCVVPQNIPEGGFYECTFTATVTGDPGSTHTNTVTACDTSFEPSVCDEGSTGVGIAGLEVLKSADPTQVTAPGGPVVYTVRVNNTGDGAISLSSLVDDQFGNITQVQGDVTFTTCVVPQNIPEGGFYECTFTATVTGNAGSTHTNEVTACATSFDPDLCDTDTADVNIVGGGTICPVEGAANQWTDILGIGMGNTNKHKVQAKITIPNAADVLSLYGQLAGKDTGDAKYVRFIYPGKNNYVQVNSETSPAPRNYAVF